MRERGNWPAFILDAQGDVLHELRTDGTPIGLFPDLELRPTDPIPLAPGSMAVFTTDGIPEAFLDVAHQEYGFERMLDVIRQAPGGAGGRVRRARARGGAGVRGPGRAGRRPDPRHLQAGRRRALGLQLTLVQGTHPREWKPQVPQLGKEAVQRRLIDQCAGQQGFVPARVADRQAVESVRPT